MHDVQSNLIGRIKGLGSSKHGNELSCPIKGEKLLDYMNNYLLSKKDFLP
jgi:hypothetical protein